MVLFLSACNSTKQQPVYEGMTISRSNLALTDENSNSSNIKLLSSKTKGEIIDDEQPLDEDVEDLVTIEVLTDDEVKYYVNPGETFIVQVHISNPNEYEIQSFTLNGTKYANYMFKDGSTLELLLLEVTAPATSGYIEYTIDAIKYIDGTEIKDVKMDGDQSIKAGIQYQNEPSLTDISLTTNTTSVQLTFTLNDTDEITDGNEVKIYLSDGEKVISEQNLQIGSNTITFDNLLMGKTYEYGIVAVYDLVDGRDLQAHWLTTSTFNTAKAYTFTNYESTQTSISFDWIKQGSFGTFKYFNLIEPTTNEVIRKIEDTSIREISNLLSNHEYIVEGVFEYTVNSELVIDSVKLLISTEAKTAPVIAITNPSVTQTSVGFDIDVTDVDSIYTLTKVELFKGATLVSSLSDLNDRLFSGLLSNNDYTIKLTHTYDLNDGDGIQTTTVSLTVTTIAKTIPVVELINEDVTFNSINALITVNDPDDINTISNIELQKNGSIVHSGSSLELSFSSLSYYTDYIIEVYYNYDLNDGAGIQNKTAEFTVKTAPYFNFYDVRVINTTAVSEGDTIFLEANIDNPSNATYSKVVVNGIEYSVSDASSNNRLFVEILNYGQFAGGNTILLIEEVEAKIDGRIYEIEVSQGSYTSVFINGNIKLKSVSFVNENLETIVDYVFPNQAVFVHIQFDNPTGYDIDSIIVRDGAEDIDVSTKLVKVDKNNYYYPTNLSVGHNFVRVSQISYSNQYLSKNKIITETDQNGSGFIIKLSSNDVHYISDAEDLLNMSDFYYYELINDIDLAGLNWFGNGFYGVFNGNGYSIKNMSNVASYQISNGISFGLFSQATGFIYNLDLSRITIMVSLSSIGNASFDAYYGGIAATGYLNFSNVTIDESSTVSIQNNTPTGLSYVGGFIGNGEGFFIDSYHYGSIYGDISGGFIGVGGGTFEKCNNGGQIIGEEMSAGFIGKTEYSYISNSYNDGVIYSENISGGFLGSLYNSSRVEIVNSYNSGSISGLEYSGGLIGKSNTESIRVIINSFNSGSVSSNSAGGLIGGYEYYENTTITNCYAIKLLNEFDSNIISLSQLNDGTFYVNVLLWDSNIWYLDNLDIEGNYYPTLKN